MRVEVNFGPKSVESYSSLILFYLAITTDCCHWHRLWQLDVTSSLLFNWPMMTLVILQLLLFYQISPLAFDVAKPFQYVPLKIIAIPWLLSKCFTWITIKYWPKWLTTSTTISVHSKWRSDTIQSMKPCMKFYSIRVRSKTKNESVTLFLLLMINRSVILWHKIRSKFLFESIEYAICFVHNICWESYEDVTRNLWSWSNLSTNISSTDIKLYHLCSVLYQTTRT